MLEIIYYFIMLCGSIYLYQEASKRSMKAWRWVGYGVAMMLLPQVVAAVIIAVFIRPGAEHLDTGLMEGVMGGAALIIGILLFVRVRKSLFREIRSRAMSEKS